jgi:hypothetical protein
MLLPVVLRQAHAAADGRTIELRIRDVVLCIASGSDVTYIATLVDALRS